MSFSSEAKDELLQITPVKPCCANVERLCLRLFGGIERSGGAAGALSAEDTCGASEADPRHWLAARSAARSRCCKKSALKAAFTVSGTVADPSKLYHLEILCRELEAARYVIWLAAAFSIDARTVERGGAWPVYIKDADSISAFLGLLGAFSALMELENIRIAKEMRNNLNRAVNCETANIDKAAQASVRQVSGILLIRESIGLDSLPAPLREIAEARLANREAGLAELGASLCPPIGKSGANHRMRKLCEIADTLRQGR